MQIDSGLSCTPGSSKAAGLGKGPQQPPEEWGLQTGSVGRVGSRTEVFRTGDAGFIPSPASEH